MNRKENFINFIKTHKKLTIILSVIFLLIITSIILIFTLFSLKEISLNFKTETQHITEEMQSDIINEIRKEGISTVLFTDKSKLIKRLEKEFPYIKIINIETVIPSTFVIHCIEREELYAIESQDKIFYLDEDLKVLKIGEDILTDQSNVVLLNIANLELSLQNIELGQFLKFDEIKGEGLENVLSKNVQKTLTSLLVSFKENNRNIAIFRSSYIEVRIDFDFRFNAFGNNTIWYVCLSLIDNNGFQTVIVEPDNKLSEKVAVMITLVNEMATSDPEELLDNRLVIYENSEGEFIYLLEEV